MAVGAERTAGEPDPFGPGNAEARLQAEFFVFSKNREIQQASILQEVGDAKTEVAQRQEGLELFRCRTLCDFRDHRAQAGWRIPNGSISSCPIQRVSCARMRKESIPSDGPRNQLGAELAKGVHELVQHVIVTIGEVASIRPSPMARYWIGVGSIPVPTGSSASPRWNIATGPLPSPGGVYSTASNAKCS